MIDHEDNEHAHITNNTDLAIKVAQSVKQQDCDGIKDASTYGRIIFEWGEA